MVFFDTLFKKKKSESVVLIDIGAASVAGAYVHYTEGEKPSLLYTRRLPIEIRKEEAHEVAMLRALAILCDTIIKEGSPVLLRAAGSGSADMIVVSVDAPWQETSVRTEHFEKKTPFVFTKSLVTKAMEQTKPPEEKRLIADESIIGTILNGYETHKPYGKSVRSASVIILTSFINRKVADSITAIVRGAYHTKRILPIADSSLRYQAMCRAFPHEHDMLILDAMGPMTSISLIRKGYFIDIVEVSMTTGGTEWVNGILTELSKLAERYPLPRTIFLLAEEADATALQKKISAASLGQLWLSDNPPTVVSVLASHLSDSIRQVTTASPDLPLLLMALYYQHRDAP